MLFLKRTLPLIITFVTGVIMIAAYFAGPYFETLARMEEQLPKWIQVIMSFTMLLGAFSLMELNSQKLKRKVDGWGYNLVLIIGFLVMATLGFFAESWPMFEREENYVVGTRYFQTQDGQKSSVPVVVKELIRGYWCRLPEPETEQQVTLLEVLEDEAKAPTFAKVKTQAGFEIQVAAKRVTRDLDGSFWLASEGEPKILQIQPVDNVDAIADPTQLVKIRTEVGMILEVPRSYVVSGLDKIVVETDQGVLINVAPNRVCGWFGASVYDLRKVMFHGVFEAAQATMFSLLAFFVASASFRAFRVKSREAMLLMGAAFVVMLGNVPIGDLVTNACAAVGLSFINIASLKEWIMIYPSSAAQSAILIGAMLGLLSASLKVIMGVERSYLGGEG